MNSNCNSKICDDDLQMGFRYIENQFQKMVERMKDLMLNVFKIFEISLLE